MKSISTVALCVFVAVAAAQEPAEKDGPDAEKPKDHPMAGLKLRSLGPALMSGRVTGFAVNPNNRSQYYAAVASGGVWKTDNAGINWKPIFDNEGSYSIGCITMDPKTRTCSGWAPVRTTANAASAMATVFINPSMVAGIGRTPG
ncbi:MAG: WD40/YVTN/BNR-like repeat-containing protein [Gemmataceae bacterium]